MNLYAEVFLKDGLPDCFVVDVQQQIHNLCDLLAVVHAYDVKPTNYRLAETAILDHVELCRTHGANIYELREVVHYFAPFAQAFITFPNLDGGEIDDTNSQNKLLTEVTYSTKSSRKEPPNVIFHEF